MKTCINVNNYLKLLTLIQVFIIGKNQMDLSSSQVVGIILARYALINSAGL